MMKPLELITAGAIGLAATGAVRGQECDEVVGRINNCFSIQVDSFAPYQAALDPSSDPNSPIYFITNGYLGQGGILWRKIGDAFPVPFGDNFSGDGRGVAIGGLGPSGERYIWVGTSNGNLARLLLPTCYLDMQMNKSPILGTRIGGLAFEPSLNCLFVYDNGSNYPLILPQIWQFDMSFVQMGDPVPSPDTSFNSYGKYGLTVRPSDGHFFITYGNSNFYECTPVYNESGILTGLTDDVTHPWSLNNGCVIKNAIRHPSYNEWTNQLMVINGYDGGTPYLSTSVDDGKVTPGDYDCDGLVTGADLDLILTDLAGPCEIPPCSTSSEFDRDGDGDVDIGDFATIMQEPQ